MGDNIAGANVETHDKISTLIRRLSLSLFRLVPVYFIKSTPRFYGFPKVHKAGAPPPPLRPIVASRGSFTYGVARHVADILPPPPPGGEEWLRPKEQRGHGELPQQLHPTGRWHPSVLRRHSPFHKGTGRQECRDHTRPTHQGHFSSFPHQDDS